MKKLFTLLAATSFAATAFAGGVPSYVRPHTPISQLAADEYLPNTMVLNVKPEFRAQCSPERIDIPAVNDFLLMIERLKRSGVAMEMEAAAEPVSNLFKDQVFVISGVFYKKSRDEVKAIIEQNGGKVSGSVSSKTNFLVHGDNMGPAKLQKATELGVTLVTEDDFLAMLENGNS
jgi:hypothetical protein